MRAFHHPVTDGHDPQFRLANGAVCRAEERPERARALLAGLSAIGITPETPPDLPMEAVFAVHSQAFVDFLRTAWDAWQAEMPGRSDEVVPSTFAQRDWATYPKGIAGRAGWHMGDVNAPIGRQSWAATCAAAACAVAAADAVTTGPAAAGPMTTGGPAAGDRMAYALSRPPGHHTDRECAGGHCLLNVAAIAAARLRETHERVAILDIDVHHGNGTQRIFYSRGDVFFASIHTDPSAFYPYFAGYADETGIDAGAGATFNQPLPRGTTDAPWLAALDAGLEQIRAFAPGALVVSLGLDVHERDPLDGMKITLDGLCEAGRRIAAAELPTAIVQEGGYVSPDLGPALTAFLGGVLGRAA